MLARSVSVRRPSSTRPRHTATSSAFQIEKPKSLLPRLKYYYDKYHLRNYAPVVILLLYSLVGAWLFHLVEYDHERELMKQEREKLQNIRNNTLTSLRLIMSERSIPETNRLQASRDILLKFEDQLFKNKLPDALKWDYWGALFYVGTVFTTIGYGNITPRTNFGRALSMLYALFGIPLVFAILNQFGKALTTWLSVAWVKYRHYVKRMRKDKQRRASEVPKKHKWSYTSRDQFIIRMEESQTTAIKSLEELEDENESRTIPIWLAFLICFGYICACAALFCIWERKWNYFTALYFIFISLSTIGLGDVVLDHPHMLILMFWLVIIGLSIVSMLLSVLQIKLEEWLYHLLIKMQRKYAQALENGEIVQSENILENLLENEPWFMRNMASHLISDKQVEEVEKQAETYERTTWELNNKIVQTDDLNEFVPVSPETQRSTAMFTAVDNITNLDDEGVNFQTAADSEIGASRDADSEWDAPSLPCDSKNSITSDSHMQDLIQAGIDHLALLGQAPTNRDEGTQANADFPSIIIEEKVDHSQNTSLHQTRETSTATPVQKTHDMAVESVIQMEDKEQMTDTTLEIKEMRRRFSNSRLIGSFDEDFVDKSTQYSFEAPKLVEFGAQFSPQMIDEEVGSQEALFDDIDDDLTFEPKNTVYKAKVMRSSSTISLNSFELDHEVHPAKEKIDIVLQTEDSYLRIARRLDEYRTIKTQPSLQVYSANPSVKSALLKQSLSERDSDTRYVLLGAPEPRPWTRRRSSSRNKNRRVSFQTAPVTTDSDKDEEQKDSERKSPDLKVTDRPEIKVDEEQKDSTRKSPDLEVTDRPEIKVDSPIRDDINKAEIKTKKRKVIKTRPKTKSVNFASQDVEKNESLISPQTHVKDGINLRKISTPIELEASSSSYGIEQSPESQVTDFIDRKTSLPANLSEQNSDD